MNQNMNKPEHVSEELQAIAIDLRQLVGQVQDLPNKRHEAIYTDVKTIARKLMIKVEQLEEAARRAEEDELKRQLDEEAEAAARMVEAHYLIEERFTLDDRELYDFTADDLNFDADREARS